METKKRIVLIFSGLVFLSLWVLQWLSLITCSLLFACANVANEYLLNRTSVVVKSALLVVASACGLALLIEWTVQVWTNILTVDFWLVALCVSCALIGTWCVLRLLLLWHDAYLFSCVNETCYPIVFKKRSEPPAGFSTAWPLVFVLLVNMVHIAVTSTVELSMGEQSRVLHVVVFIGCLTVLSVSFGVIVYEFGEKLQRDMHALGVGMFFTSSSGTSCWKGVAFIVDDAKEEAKDREGGL